MNKKHEFLQPSKKKIRIFLLITSLFLFLILINICYLSSYKGKVIDAVTKQPIKGAVIHVVYWRKAPCTAFKRIKGAYVRNLITAREVITDQNGEFNITGKVILDPRSSRPKGDLNISKPSYGLFPNHEISIASEGKKYCSDYYFLPTPGKYIVYELPKLRSIEDRKGNVKSAKRYYTIPYRKKKLYWGIINQERKSVGLHLRILSERERSKE